jgi:hypothetical protein
VGNTATQFTFTALLMVRWRAVFIKKGGARQRDQLIFLITLYAQYIFTGQLSINRCEYGYMVVPLLDNPAE